MIVSFRLFFELNGRILIDMMVKMGTCPMVL